MNTTLSSTRSADSPALSHQEVASRAYALWIECGEPQGSDDEIWFEAERRLLALLPLPRTGASLLPAIPTVPDEDSRVPDFRTIPETPRSRRELLSDLEASPRRPIQRDLGVRAIAATSDGPRDQVFFTPGTS